MPAPTLDTIRAALRKGGLNAASLADLVSQAEKLSAAAAERSRTAAAVLVDQPLASAADRAKHRETAAAAHLEAEDASAVLAVAQRAHAEAFAAEQEARRTELYQAGQRASATAVATLTKDYPRACNMLLGILKQVAEAQHAVAASNAELPAGAEPLPDPEIVARGVPGQPREVVAEKIVELWSRHDLLEPIAAEFQDEIYATSGGWGKRSAAYIEKHYKDPASSLSQGESQALYRLRRYRKITSRDPISGTHPMPLAAALHLPELHSDKAFWGNSFPAGVSPALSQMMLGAHEPDAVIAALANIEAAAVAKPVKVEPQTRITFELIGDVVPLPAEQPMDPRKSQPLGRGIKAGTSPFNLGRAAGGRR